jgi:nitroimidazol reductase NimA-like FMN-containing flavoprotein (pyridoxamine 5'-phosphate oxidase superfamily)
MSSIASSTPPSNEPAALPPSARTRVRRIPEFARYDAATVHAIVDAALVCHIAFAGPDGVHCIPTGCWRQGDHLYIHGSNGSRMLKVLQSGVSVAVTITLLDGLVLARSAFNHALNYRSAVIYGAFEMVPDAEKPAALAAFLERILPGRQASIRPGDANELAATTVLRIGLHESAAKVRQGPPEDNADDMDWPVWAGVLPMRMTPLAAICDPTCAMMPPPHVTEWPRRRLDEPGFPDSAATG